jgi:hypothetical protein
MPAMIFIATLIVEGTTCNATSDPECVLNQFRRNQDLDEMDK